MGLSAFGFPTLFSATFVISVSFCVFLQWMGWRRACTAPASTPRSPSPPPRPRQSPTRYPSARGRLFCRRWPMCCDVWWGRSFRRRAQSPSHTYYGPGYIYIIMYIYTLHKCVYLKHYIHITLNRLSQSLFFRTCSCTRWWIAIAAISSASSTSTRAPQEARASGCGDSRQSKPYYTIQIV